MSCFFLEVYVLKKTHEITNPGGKVDLTPIYCINNKRVYHFFSKNYAL